MEIKTKLFAQTLKKTQIKKSSENYLCCLTFNLRKLFVHNFFIVPPSEADDFKLEALSFG